MFTKPKNMLKFPKLIFSTNFIINKSFSFFYPYRAALTKTIYEKTYKSAL